MSEMKLTKENLEALIIGGCILGGGGGGSIKIGQEIIEDILKHGEPHLVSVDEMQNDDIVICASAVGAPAAKDLFMSNEDRIESIAYFVNDKKYNVKGIITNENGGFASINGLLQAAALNIPFIDCPCNGRAHPTGLMGSLGLHKLAGYQSVQAVAGGNPKLDKRVSMVVKASLASSAALVRQAAIEAGGVVAVARNPVNIAYLKEHGAIGGITMALELGELVVESLKLGVAKTIDKINNFLSGETIGIGKVCNLKLETRNGFDIGRFMVNDLEITFWNEYMSISNTQNRLATFPDLIMTFDAKTGMPITSAELIENQDIYVIKTNYQNLKLSSTMFDQELLNVIEKELGIDVCKYLNK